MNEQPIFDTVETNADPVLGSTTIQSSGVTATLQDSDSTADMITASAIVHSSVAEQQTLNQIAPSACSCESEVPATAAPALVYALGHIGTDFGDQARRDSFVSLMPEGTLPDNPNDLVEYLQTNESECQSLIWTLNLDATPIYAIRPVGAYAAKTFETLLEARKAFLDNPLSLTSLPGVVSGSVRLQSGQTVPVIIPSERGMFVWGPTKLVQHSLGDAPADEGDLTAYNDESAKLTSYLSRIYYELRNLGLSPQDRAVNFAGTNLFQAKRITKETKGLALSNIEVLKSKICRPGADCYDIRLSMFDPSNTNIADTVFEYTVDVSGVIPVLVGNLRSWSRRT